MKQPIKKKAPPKPDFTKPRKPLTPAQIRKTNTILKKYGQKPLPPELYPEKENQ